MTPPKGSVLTPGLKSSVRLPTWVDGVEVEGRRRGCRTDAVCVPRAPELFQCRRLHRVRRLGVGDGGLGSERSSRWQSPLRLLVHDIKVLYDVKGVSMLLCELRVCCVSGRS